MSSTSKAQSTEVGSISHQSEFPGDPNFSNSCKSQLEHGDEEEEEEEDVDFNPFLKESPSLEASSSMSSEVEVLDADVSDGKGNAGVDLATNLSSLPPGQVQDYALGDSEHGEEIVMQAAVSSGGADEGESETTSSTRFKKRKAQLISQPESETFLEKESGSGSGTDVVNDGLGGDITHLRNPVMEIDDEDAICKRTRARYSLAGFTLDELEAFLQETDDEDDLQNVNEEDEYRKFLAAVLQGGICDSPSRQGDGSVDEEDEDNDADFELEIEEALESDLDENPRGDTQQESEAAGRRPETRLIRRQKASVRQKIRPLGQHNKPLRPLLPNAPIASYPVFIPETAPQFLSLSGHNGFTSGFTPHQLGQLHCLIYEHAQLLIQVFSLSVLEPSRQHIASQVQELILEMLHKRDEVMSCRKEPYPHLWFCPPYIHPSVQHGLSKSLTAPCTPESACSFDKQRDCSSEANKGPLPGAISPPSRRRGYASVDQNGLFQASDSALWAPFVNGPILSVLDVAPLKFVGKYIDDVSIAVREHRVQRVQAACDTHFEKEPLFPFHSSESFSETNTSNVSSYSADDQPPKKTLAAVLVERTKKQSIALVPKQIAKLAQRFLPLFNPALFPHKPPLTSVGSRVLFTDTEDELLALGLMEYNTDWKAIQQRFLPCKSKHQIFVRQKNRSSSKAPENPIKAVRRMKGSPLTPEEKARIQEGLKVFKLDWMSVWKYIVPYRDPSLLPRQWRTATGTQKSYKSTADKREKRRLYEFNRRKCKPATLSSWQTSSEKDDCQAGNADGEINSGDDCMGNEDEAYVHEAFLADWRPDSPLPVSSWLPVSSIIGFSNIRGKNQPSNLLSQRGSCVMEQTNSSGFSESQPNVDLQLSAAFEHSQNLHTPSYFTHTRHHASPVKPNQPVSNMTSRPSKSQFCLLPYRSRRTSSAHLVRLAPDLPPVNLPPSVRVISQSALKGYQGGAFAKAAAADAGRGSAATEKITSSLPRVANSGSYPLEFTETERILPEKSNANQQRQESSVLQDKCVAVGRDESYLHMHPLLFQTSKDGRLPYYPLNCGSGVSSSFNFLSRIQPHLNVSLLNKPDKANQTVSHFDKSSKSKGTSSAGSIDFHPLLQKADDANSDFVTAHSVPLVSANLEKLRSSGAQLQNSFDPVRSTSQANSSVLASCAKSCSPDEKSNELDLEIHLSFTSRTEKAIGTTDVIEQDRTTENFSALGSGTTTVARATKSSYYQHNECFPVASVPNRISKEVDGAHAVVPLSSNISDGYGVNCDDDQSLPEIVMEQEELSDSEEEIGEHVEFECEEMDDSEGDEGSDCEQIMAVQNKVPNATTDEVARDLSLTAQGKEKQRSPSCSSLSSCAPSRPPPSKTQPKATDSAGKNRPPSRPNRSCKKLLSQRRHISARKHAADPSQQPVKGLESGSAAAASPLRGSGKSGCRSNPGLNMSRAGKRDSNVNTGLTVENSDTVSDIDFG